MPPYLDLVALYGVPIVSGLITMGVLVGPASERPAFGARVYGHVAEGTRRCALRVHVRQHVRGSFADFATPFSVGARVGQRPMGEASAEGTEAVSDVTLALTEPAREDLQVSVTAEGVFLAEVAIDVQPSLVAAVVPRHRNADDDTEIDVGLVRGFAVPELPEVLAVEVRAASSEAAPTIEVVASGADVGKPRPGKKHCANGRCSYAFAVDITARAPAVDLDVRAVQEGEVMVGWSGPLAIAPGRIWLDPAATDQWRFASSVPRDEVFVSLFDRGGRVWGTRVRMTTDAVGFARGATERPELPDGPVVVVLSSEADEPEIASAPWPVGRETLQGTQLVLLGDGMPAAVRREKQRRQDARRPAYGLIAAAAVFELLFLAWRSRRARRRLESHLAREEGATKTVESALPLTAMVVVAGALVLAFVILGALAALA